MFDGRFRSAVDEGVAPVGTSLGSRRLKADYFTALGLVLAAACAVVIAAGHLLIGLILLILAAVPDLLDGAVAKATGTASVRGAFFDSVSDRVVDSLVLGGLAWYLASTRHGHWAVLPFAVLAVSNLVSYERAKAESLGFTAKGGLMERAERIVVLCIGLAFPVVLVPVLWVMLGLTSLTAIQRFVKVWRQAPGPGVAPSLDQLRRERAELRAERSALRAERAALRARGEVPSRWREWRDAREAELRSRRAEAGVRFRSRRRAQGRGPRTPAASRRERLGGWAAETRRVAPLHLYRAGSLVARGLPGRFGEAFAAGAGVIAGRVAARRRATITGHLQRIEGGPVDRRTVDRAFASYGRYWLEAFRLPSVAVDDLELAMSYEGIGNIEEGRALGRGVLLAMPHIGAWDWGGAWLAASGFPLTVVAEVLEPVELADWFTSWRRRVGMTVVPLDQHAASGVFAALRRGDVVGLLCDRDLTGDGIEVTFFGERTRMPAGPATIALRTGAPLMPCCVIFEGDHHRGIVLPPLDTARRGSLRDDVARVTQEMADALAGLIRRAPEQWHVFQPNWPSDRGTGR